MSWYGGQKVKKGLQTNDSTSAKNPPITSTSQRGPAGPPGVKVQERDSTVQDGKRPQTTVGSARSPMPGNGHTAQSTPTGSKLTKDKVYFASYEEAYQDLNGKHQRLKKHAQDQAAELSELGHCYDDLNAGFDKLKIEKQTLTDELRALQTQSFKSLDDAHWMAMDAEVSRRRLENIRQAIDATAKTYAAPVGSLPSTNDLPADQVQHIRASLRHVLKFKGIPEDTNEELKTIPHAPRLCLAALISNDIHEHVLNNPFFFVPEEKQLHGPASSAFDGTGLQTRLATTNHLLHIWQEGQKYDAETANVWRSDTLRLLNPRHRTSAAAESQIVELLDQMQKSCSDYAVECMQKIPPVFLKKMEQSMRSTFEQEIVKAFQDGGRLSLDLWVERPLLYSSFLLQLAERPFKNGLTVMKAHKLHRLDDCEDRSLDGKFIKIVVHPVMSTTGTHEAESYHQHRQLYAPAVVWLDLEQSTCEPKIESAHELPEVAKGEDRVV